VVAMLFKYALLLAALEQEILALTLVIACVVGRFLATVYVATAPYAREQGMAAGFDISPYTMAILAQGALIVMVAFMLLGVLPTLVMMVMLGLWLLWWRRHWMRYIGGYTGDCLGATIEIAECLTLLAMVWAMP